MIKTAQHWAVSGWKSHVNCQHSNFNTVFF